MTIQQLQPENYLNLDVVTALRHVNAWETSNTATGKIRIRILRDYSAEFIEPFLKYYFGTRGLQCEVVFGGFDCFAQEVLDDQDTGHYDLIVLSLTADGLVAGRYERVKVEDAFAGVVRLSDRLCSAGSATVILNTITRPLLDNGGASYSLRSESLTARVDDYNRLLRSYVAGRSPRCLLIDWERLVMLIGADAAFDRRMAYLASAPFRQGFLNLYAREIFRIGRALRGYGKKCLVLDCDNTLWGGVLGEVGLDGIELDPNQYPGKAYHDFQRAVVRLAEQGTMVALCSKNNLEDVMAVLDQHPNCLIRREHLCAYQVNWQDKEVNLEHLIKELNIAAESVVFVDDSPTECARIRALLPAVAVRQVPEKLYDLPLLLDSEGLFDKLATTEEDLARAQSYQSEHIRRAHSVSYANAEDFLASLELVAQIGPARRSDLPRISQLTQKTNQFNLTTRRYSEGEIAKMADDPHHAVYALSVRDRFGDLGLTGVLIARRNGEGAHIDTLLMSCRVLGRRLEDQFVVHCLSDLNKRWGPRFWNAEFIRTQKNRQVASFWSKFGFEEVQSGNDATLYRAEASALALSPIPFIAVELR